LKDFATTIREKKRFLLTTHVQPDGDGIGSQMGLYGFLKSRGKEVFIINPSPTPEKFSIADPKGVIRTFVKGDSLPAVDAVIIVDTNETKMLGDLAGAVEKLGAPILFIDHHVKELKDTSGHLIDEKMSSSGELVYHFIQSEGGEVDSAMAVALYVAIVTDTGNFRFQRTSPTTHEIAAALLKKGVKPESIFQSIYSHDSIDKLRLLGETLKSVQLSPNGKIAWVSITKEARKNSNATVEDTESFIGHLSVLKGVCVAALFREEDNGTTKLSLRGLRNQPVVNFAKKFGGGGHQFAAGAKINKPLASAISEVIQEIDSKI
jgi:phosphoesterase RecJ-like protein